MKKIKDFNPRSHERSDYNYNILNNICDISIHAPTRGATFTNGYAGNFIVNFNPRSHERSDMYLSSWIMNQLNFNPRSHERSDTHDRK